MYALPKITVTTFLFFFMSATMLLLTSSCDKNKVFEQNVKIEKGMWEGEQPIILLTQINDTVTPHNVYINLRNAGTYPFSNIFLFINTRLPGGQLDRDTVEIMLASKEGKWLGKGVGDIWDDQVLFKHNVRFPQKGEYRFEITHAMRMNPLPGIVDGGIRIEKVGK